MPEVEGAHAHRKLHSVDFIERRRMCEKVQREGGKKKERGFNHGLLAGIALFHLGRGHGDHHIRCCSAIDSYFSCQAAARQSRE